MNPLLAGWYSNYIVVYMYDGYNKSMMKETVNRPCFVGRHKFRLEIKRA